MALGDTQRSLRLIEHRETQIAAGEETEMTLWQRWVTDNPVFRYHLFGHTKMKLRRPLWQIISFLVPFTSVFLWLIDRAIHEGGVEFYLGLEALVLWLVAPLMTHSIMAMEFEKATWEALVLTRLTAGQIVMGKFLSRLALLGISVSLFAPLLWLAAAHDFTGMSPLALLWWAIKTQLVIVSWTILLIAVTLWLSYWLKRGMAAAAVAFAGQVFVLFILPILWMLFVAMFYAAVGRPIAVSFGFEQGWEWDWLRRGWMVDLRFAPLFYNPAYTLIGVLALRGMPTEQTPFLWGTWQGVTYLLLAGLVVVILIRSVAKATRKPM